MIDTSNIIFFDEQAVDLTEGSAERSTLEGRIRHVKEKLQKAKAAGARETLVQALERELAEYEDKLKHLS